MLFFGQMWLWVQNYNFNRATEFSNLLVILLFQYNCLHVLSDTCMLTGNVFNEPIICTCNREPASNFNLRKCKLASLYYLMWANVQGTFYFHIFLLKNKIRHEKLMVKFGNWCLSKFMKIFCNLNSFSCPPKLMHNMVENLRKLYFT